MKSLFIRYIKCIHYKKLFSGKKVFQIRPCGDSSINKEKVTNYFICLFPRKLTVSIIENQQIIELWFLKTIVEVWYN
jgi:hypothetical protein